MKNELNINNSKKLVIGISILFCTVILIIGGSIAYFTQSDSKDIGNIVSADQITLEYNDDFNENTIYNRQGLIPSSYDNVITAYNRDGDKKCLDINDYSACSIYRFSVKNNSQISQVLQMSLHPTANSYTNLKFLLFELNGESKKEVMSTTDLVKGNYEGIPLLGNYTLNPNNSKMYEIVFYIENLDSDQTSDDASKTFGAGIKINSITTGKYVTKQYSTTCWTTNLIPEGEENAGTYRLDAFHGLNDDGSVREECNGYIEQDVDTYYKVFVPSEVGGKQITTIGSKLITTVDEYGNYQENNYRNIKSLEIEEGITRIDDYFECGRDYCGTFQNLGLVEDWQNGDYCLFDLEVSLPNSLTYIGGSAFSNSCIKNLRLPSNLKVIGDYSFYSSSISSDVNNPLVIPYSVNYIGFDSFSNNDNLKRIIFDGSLTEISDDNQLTIGDGAFGFSGLSYLEKKDPLILPARLSYQGGSAFYTEGVKYVKYMGSKERFEALNESYWYGTYAKSYEEYDNE